MEFRQDPDRSGLDIHDPVENARFALYTPEDVEPMPVSTEEFHFPVDSAVAIGTKRIELPDRLLLTVRERDGTTILEAMPVEFEGDLYWSDEISASDLT